MHCEEVRKSFEEAGEEGFSAPARRHFESCAVCQAHAREWRHLVAGMRLLAQESAPEPSIGFSARVLRRLREGDAAGFIRPEFLESVGRRVVLATLVLFVTLLLAMILPASGPVRHKPSVDAYWPQPETASAASYPISFTETPSLPVILHVEPADYDWNP
ncbi:MAG TPA: hypothetical protein VFZ08_09495 [Terriglobia bacterium]|nr:hypothetical protein [Terriglobia bacterium]